MKFTQNQIEQLVLVMQEASRAVMDIYITENIDVVTKSDNSPVTNADVAAHGILMEALPKLFPDIPVVSEEGDQTENRRLVAAEDTFWLVDPLDGTKDFIDRTDHFCVAVGLIENGRPSFGIVAAPADNGSVYYGGKDYGSYKIEHEKPVQQLQVAGLDEPILLRSRSHDNEATATYVEQQFPGIKTDIAGSMLKYLYIAEGKASYSPRLATKMKLWDLAAGNAILQGAGGDITTPAGEPLNYNAVDLIVPEFLAFASAPPEVFKT